MNVRALVGLGLLGVATLGSVRYLADPEATRMGQLVFTPWNDIASAQEDPALPLVSIYSCEVSSDGLSVRGHVDAGGGVTPILVIPGDPGNHGVAVSAAFAASSGRIPQGSVGDFVVILPWATRASRFAVADAASLGLGPEGVRFGRVSSCGSDDPIG